MGEKLLSFAADFYVDFIRTTPLLLHLFFIFYALPFVGIRLDPLPAGIASDTLGANLGSSRPPERTLGGRAGRHYGARGSPAGHSRIQTRGSRPL